MANRSAILTVKILSDASKASKGVDQATSRIGKFQSGLKKAAIPAAVIGAAVVKFGVDSVNAAREAAVAQARLEAVFKSMGDTTGESAKHADAYASALSRQIGVDDEVIKSGQAKLATFSNVSNKAAIMAGVFDRATSAGADLAAAGFGSIDSNAVLLGKALQDPIKGVSALARVGVTLTDAQKKSAAQMAKNGDVIGAQKIILGAVETQVKGTAAATATSTDKMKVAYGKLQEKMGSFLLPIVDKLVLKFAGLADWMNKNSTLALVLVGVVGGLAAAVLVLNAAAKAYKSTLVIVQAVQKATWLSNPIFLVIAAIVLLVAGFVILYRRSKTFRDFVNGMWGGIKSAAVATANVIKAIWRAVWAAASAYVRVYVAVVRFVFGVIRGAASAVGNAVKAIWRAVWAVVGGYVKAYGGAVKAGLAVVRGAVAGVIAYIRSAFKGVWAAVESAARTAAGVLSKPFAAVETAIRNVISAVESLIGWLSRIHVPKISLPKLPKGLHFAFNAAPAPATGPGGFRASRMPGTRASSSSAGPSIVVNVNGALDPESVARQIRRILDGHDRRVGLVGSR